jgi:hypothetical protein
VAEEQIAPWRLDRADWTRKEDATQDTRHSITLCRMRDAFDADNNLIALHTPPYHHHHRPPYQPQQRFHFALGPFGSVYWGSEVTQFVGLDFVGETDFGNAGPR